jgi:RNA polymerase sigma factor (sigma-70 family)
MLGSPADAEDAVQHTFMAAYADLMRSDRPIALRPWLYTIARHRCLSMLRTRRERPVAELPEPEVDLLTAEVDAREELRATLADIAHLPDDQRAALILAELGDASHAEIAQILGCRHEKVKALVFQARSSLASGRTARDTPCFEIREQLAAGGLAIRRTSLRRHVRDCEGCREFGEQMQLQRRRLRILIPVAPSLGFKRAIFGAALGSGSGAGGLTATVGTFGGLAVTAAVSVTIAGGGGSPAAAAPIATAAPRAGVASHPRPTAARADPRRATPVTRRREPAARTRRRRAIEPSKAPAAATAPADKPARSAPEATPEPAVEAVAAQPPAGGPPPEPPGEDRRATPPEPPRKPAEPPGKPAEPPGKPAEPPGNPDPGPPVDVPEPEPGGPAKPPPRGSDPGAARPGR